MIMLTAGRQATGIWETSAGPSMLIAGQETHRKTLMVLRNTIGTLSTTPIANHLTIWILSVYLLSACYELALTLQLIVISINNDLFFHGKAADTAHTHRVFERGSSRRQLNKVGGPRADRSCLGSIKLLACFQPARATSLTWLVPFLKWQTRQLRSRLLKDTIGI
jgi:hypothetical protein